MNEREIFHTAMEITDLAERSAYLDEQCADNPTRRQHVEALLDMHPQLGSFLESPAVDMDPAVVPPLNAGRFQLGEELARGGMGVVYRARDDSLGRDVAVKVLHELYLVDSPIGRRFMDEARITAQLQHPGIPPVFEVGRLPDDRPYLAMKLIKGRTLDALLQERPGADADRGRFLSIFQQICQAVGYAHSKHILHRDLKPANVMVGGFGEVQVMDWGLAKVLEPGGGAGPEPTANTETSCGTVIHTTRERDSATEAGSMLGTPAFIPPEQAGGELDRLNERTDVFGLGAILCVILTGQPPYVGKSAAEVRLMAIRGELAEAHVRLKECGADAKLVDLCRQCLSAGRDARPRDAAAVAAAITDYLAGVEERARRAEIEWAAAEARAAEQRKRRRVQLALAATVVLLLGLAGFGLSWHQRVEAIAAAERAAHDSRVAAGVTEALREARERALEAWTLADFPERMEHATGAAVAALRRAEDFASSGAPDETARDLDSARGEVDELSRHTRLLRTCADIRHKFAQEVTGQGWSEEQARFVRRYSEALREFGLDPDGDRPDEVAQAVATSRLRDILLGLLLDRHWHSRARANPHLWQVIRSTRQLSGGPYARWQEVIDRKDVSGLVAFAASPEGLSFRSILVAALFRDLRDAKQYAACQAFLRAAVERYPHEAWMHYDLADICRGMEPPNYAEALRHSSAATVQRPDCAVFQLQLGDCYADLGSYPQADAAFRRSVELGRGTVAGYIHMGRALAKKKDWDGARAVLREAIRLQPRDVAARNELVAILIKAGRNAEGLQVMVDALQEHPDLAEDPRNYLRYNAACLAINCADGLGANAPPPNERPAYRKQAFELLTAALAGLCKLTAPEGDLVHYMTQYWLMDKDLASVRDPSAVSRLPSEERDAWNKLWADVRLLRSQTAPQTGAAQPVKPQSDK